MTEHAAQEESHTEYRYYDFKAHGGIPKLGVYHHHDKDNVKNTIPLSPVPVTAVEAENKGQEIQTER